MHPSWYYCKMMMICILNLDLASWMLSACFAFLLIVVLPCVTYRRWQTRRLLEKAGLPTILWTPRFINYQLRSSSTCPTVATKVHRFDDASIQQPDKKLTSSTITNILPRMERLGGPFGMYGTVYGISTPVIHVAHPTPARAILAGEGATAGPGLPLSATTGATKAPAYNHFKNFSGNGVFTADGETWREKRASVIHSLFRSRGSGEGGGQAFSQLLQDEANHAADVFIQQVERQRRQENKNVDDVVLRTNIVPMLQRSTIGLIYRYLTHDQETATSLIEYANTKLEDDENSMKTKGIKSATMHQQTALSLEKYLGAITNIRMILLAQSRSLWYLFPRWCYRYMSSMYQEEERTLRPIREFARMACLKAKPSSPLFRLLSRQSHSSTKDMLDEAITLLFAGQDTSAATLSWTIHLLSLYPIIQDKLAAEVISVVSPSNSDASDQQWCVKKAHFARMPYLDAVIKEAMRLYPVAPFVVRKLSHDVTVVGASNGAKGTSGLASRVTLPAGAVACIWIYGLHRNPALWDQPDDFIPERWLEDDDDTNGANHLNSKDDSATDHRVCHEAYMPFALGPRNCVGQPMAHVILRVLLARLILRYKFCDERLLSASSTGKNRDAMSSNNMAKMLQKDMQAGFTVLPLGGVHVAIHPRKITKPSINVYSE